MKSIRPMTVGLSVLLWSSSGPGGVSPGGPGFASEVHDLGDRVAQWQLDHREDLSWIRTFRDHSADPRGWVQAAFYIGLSRWHRASGNPDYGNALRALAEHNGWRVGERFWHADDQAIAQVYLALDEPQLEQVKDAFDRVLEHAPDGSLEFVPDPQGVSEGICQWRWCWSDALFMAPPAWAGLSRVTGDPRYLDHAVGEYRATRNALFDEDAGLFYRDTRFIDRRGEHGSKVFWSRGNGWVFAGLPLLLEQMPKGHPDREYFIETFRTMAAAFRDVQAYSGLWAPSLLDFAHDPRPETSGSAFIVFGLAWGVNHGYLCQERFGQVIDRAWRSLAAAVDDEGRLTWVQQVGNAPDEVRATDAQFYGSGAFLLAASEMLEAFRSPSKSAQGTC